MNYAFEEVANYLKPWRQALTFYPGDSSAEEKLCLNVIKY